MKKGFAVTAAVGLLCLSSLAHAALFKNTFTGNGSFKLNGVSYGDSNFTITTIFDTAKRQYNQGSHAYWIDNDWAQITFQGLGTYKFLTATRVFCNIDVGTVGLSRGGNAGSDLYDIGNIPALKDWDLLTPFGPVASPSAILTQWGGSYAPDWIHTDAGVLAFANKDDVSATFKSEPVPEPSSLVAMFAGIWALVPLARRSRR